MPLLRLHDYPIDQGIIGLLPLRQERLESRRSHITLLLTVTGKIDVRGEVMPPPMSG